MPQLTISVKNATLVNKNLRDMSAAIPQIARDDIESVFKRIIKQVQKYPPAPSGSRYVRTNNLKNSPRLSSTPAGFRLEINPISPKGRAYGRYVIGDFRGAGQAWMHVGRWLLLRDIADFELTKLPDVVYDHIRQLAFIKGLT